MPQAPQTLQKSLAIRGGSKVRQTSFPEYRTLGEEEKSAVNRVLDGGVLSKFLGCWHDDFYGGPEVRGLEAEWAQYFGVKHAVTVNSATSALFAAVGALGIEPGDEVIVSPYTMSASAIAPLIYNAIPVFADIEADMFCLSAESIESRITERTRAIIVVDIFGQPYDAPAINALAKKHDIKIIEDCAQAPGGRFNGQFSGTLGDIGIYSLNYHKHIHTGEGGVLVTDDDEIAERLKLIRNHAEVVLQGKHPEPESWTPSLLSNMMGYNYRMTEIEAAIGREQLKKLDALLQARLERVQFLNDKLGEIPCINPARIRPSSSGEETVHAFYVHAMTFDPSVAGVHRDVFMEAVNAEGVPVSTGYVKPIYWQPMYQKRQAYGTSQIPWSLPEYSGDVDYREGLCPVTERMHTSDLFLHTLVYPELTERDLQDVVDAFTKVWERREELKESGGTGS